MTQKTEQVFLLNGSENQSVLIPVTRRFSTVDIPGTAPVNLENVQDFSKVCRTCATITDLVIPIFSGEGLQNNLAEKIQKHLPIQVCEEDVLPRVVCYQCASTLLAVHELAQCASQADVALRARMQRDSQPELKATAPTANPEEDSQSNSSEPEARAPEPPEYPRGPQASCYCSYCGTKHFAADFEKHLIVEHCHLIFHCENCDRYEDRKEFMTHMAYHATQYKKTKKRLKKRSNKFTAISSVAIEDTTQIPFAIVRPQGPVIQTNEFSDQSDVEFGFGIPESVFEAIEDTQDSQRLVGEGSSPENVNIITETSLQSIRTPAQNIENSLESVEIPMQIESEPIQSTCIETPIQTADISLQNNEIPVNNSEMSLQSIATPIQNEILLQNIDTPVQATTNSPPTIKTPIETSNISLHNIETSTQTAETSQKLNESPPTLETPSETLQQVKTLSVKIPRISMALFESAAALLGINQTTEEPQTAIPTKAKQKKTRTCPKCSKVYTAASSYFYHLKYSHRSKDISCKICNAKFTSQMNLAQHHASIHTRELKYKCKVCDKRFRSKASLYIHERTHSGVKTWACSQCNISFRWKTEMLRHLKRHGVEKSHICETCGRGFKLRYDLLRHTKTHSAGSYSCEKCGQKFAQQRYLKTHMERKHSAKVAKT